MFLLFTNPTIWLLACQNNSGLFSCHMNFTMLLLLMLDPPRLSNRQPFRYLVLLVIYIPASCSHKMCQEAKTSLKKGFDECYDKDKVNENGRFTNKMLVINKLWCKEGSLKICKISKVNVLTIPPSKTSMSSFPYCQQLLCRQPQIDPMGLKGTYSKINTVLYYISRVKVTPTDSP